jgi:hypothetical protein
MYTGLNSNFVIMIYTFGRSPGMRALLGVGPVVRLDGSLIQGRPSVFVPVDSFFSISTAVMELFGILVPSFATIFVVGADV